ncbi:Eco57I restriction-modification methylase domain-containing protein [Verrucomicrobiota bacterium]
MNTNTREHIETALLAFAKTDLKTAAIGLLSVLGYKSEKTLDLDGTPDAFLAQFDQDTARPFRKDKAIFDQWKSIDFLFQLTDDEVRTAGAQPELSFDSSTEYDGKNYTSYLFFALDLEKGHYTRTYLSDITREINRLVTMPAMILFKQGGLLTLSVINRRISKKDPEKDVLKKVTLIKDIRCNDPHRAHIEILHDLSMSELLTKHECTDFKQLHEAWQKTLDTNELNKKFYRELANWYFWALDHVEFPADIEKDAATRNATSVIRMLTRLIFCWFLKEKNLVPPDLFNERKLETVLKSLKDDDSTFYRAILQNLFFATLNQKMNVGKEINRKFAEDKTFQGKRHDHGIKNFYRYKEFFKDSNAALKLFEDIPFLNGGLFDCLDKEDDKGKVQYVDGFTRNARKQPRVPNFLFFSDYRPLDLSDAYGDKKKKKEKVRGLINLLDSYKFTITENTPIEEEIALDPELLGKVFENLLASYNPETGTTARKQTGSFYTPREIVNYMVDESLIAYLKGKLEPRIDTNEHEKVGTAVPAVRGDPKGSAENGGTRSVASAEKKLRLLFAYTEEPRHFSDAEVNTLIDAIDNAKILDPACGSGAFPMGILHKLVFILGKLDPHNERWKRKQMDKLDSVSMREELERTFENNDDDFGRKLYLIENCIYGVDIQPIAIQISKLRFFISLICDQRTNKNKAQNCGVRPLPNLETKFVAANTLISLEKQDGFLKDPRITRLEKDLAVTRHKHFAAQRRRDKLALQKSDKELREEIAAILKAGGMSGDASRKMADWDPYDQNAHSEFFDSEWMFGIKAGFDVVIGNPPYGADLPEDQLKVIKSQLKDTNNANSAAVFLDFSKNRIIKTKGVIAFIVPKSLLFSEKWLSLAETLAPKTIALVDVQKAFDNVLLEQVVFVYDHAKTRETYLAQKFINTEFSRQVYLPVTLLQRFKSWLCGVSEPEIAIAIKMTDNSISLSQISETMRGLPLQSALKKKGEIPIIGGKNVQRYAIDGAKGYLGKTDLVSAKNKVTALLRPKIVSQNIVAHIENPTPHIQITSAMDLDGDLFSVDTVNNTFLTTDKYDLRFILALLNSRVTSWYAYRFVFGNAIRTMHFDNYYIGKLPMPKATPSEQAPLICLVDRILAAKKGDRVADTSALEQEIDQLVYKLYGLTPEEIKIVEGRA